MGSGLGSMSKFTKRMGGGLGGQDVGGLEIQVGKWVVGGERGDGERLV